MPEGRPTSILAEYATKLFEGFETARRQNLEPRWNENRDNFNAKFKELWKAEEGKDWRSKATPDTVRQKVMTAFAIMCDIALQGGKLPFSLKPSARLLGASVEAAGQYKQATDDGANVIHDQFAKCHADRAYMANIMAGAIYGITYAKRIRETYTTTGFEPLEVQGIADLSSIPPEALQWESRTFSEEGPGWVACSNWEIYADPEANYDPRRGQGWFHCRLVSAGQIRQKLGKAWFIDEAIEEVLKAARAKKGGNAGIHSTSLPPYLRDIAERKQNVWYRESFLRVPRTTADAFEQQLRAMQGRKRDDGGRFVEMPVPSVAEYEDDGDDVWVHLVMAEGQIIRYVRVDPEDNPLYSAKWEDVIDEPGGRGVADSAKLGHEGIAKTLRAIEDNVNWAENVQGILKPRMLTGTLKNMKPGQMLEANDECQSAADAFMQLKVDLAIDGLLSLLSLHEKYTDWSTMFPKITQGQIEKSQATATEIMEQAERADKYTGSVMRNYDEGLVEPIVTDIFRENMRDPSITKGRGDFVVQALGFQAFKDRITRTRQYRIILELALSSPEIMAEFKLRGLLEPLVAAAEIDKDSVLKTEEEKQAEAEQQAAMQQQMQEAQQPANDPLAEARAERERAVGQAALMKATTEKAKLELEAERHEREAAGEQPPPPRGRRQPVAEQTAAV